MGGEFDIMRRFFLWFFILITALPAFAEAYQPTDSPVALAYVHQNILKLADAQGNPLYVTGPEFQVGQSARLFWSPDGSNLYIARRDGLFETRAMGGAAARIPGDFGLTVTLDRTGQILYYLDTRNPTQSTPQSATPAETPANTTFSYPLRELALRSESQVGRLVGYVGEYLTSTGNVVLNGAALQYARDGGLLEAARPNLFSTYGDTLFYSCCFPNAGMQAISLQSGTPWFFEGTQTLIAGRATLNNTYSRLAGPTTDGRLVVVDLITAGVRTYLIDAGEIERVAWSPDDTALYLAVRTMPRNLLELAPHITTPVDTRSATISIWRLDLISAQLWPLATLGEFYGVSSMVATHQYIFAVTVENNARLVEALNNGTLSPDIDPSDPTLNTNYLPGTILYRLTPDGREAFSILSDVWGLAVRPSR